MTYNVIVNGALKKIKGVSKILDRGDNFTFKNVDDVTIFIVNKNIYSIITLETEPSGVIIR